MKRLRPPLQNAVCVVALLLLEDVFLLQSLLAPDLKKAQIRRVFILALTKAIEACIIGMKDDVLRARIPL